MPEHLKAGQLDRYCRRSMSRAELFAADDHLNACDECRSRLASTIDSSRDMWSDVQEAPDQDLREHLSFEEMEGYVDGALAMSERECIELHAEICEICRRELRDLQSFASGQAAFAAVPDVVHRTAVVARSMEASRNTTAASWRETLKKLAMMLGGRGRGAAALATPAAEPPAPSVLAPARKPERPQSRLSPEQIEELRIAFLPRLVHAAREQFRDVPDVENIVARAFTERLATHRASMEAFRIAFKRDVQRRLAAETQRVDREGPRLGSLLHSVSRTLDDGIGDGSDRYSE